MQAHNDPNMLSATSELVGYKVNLEMIDNPQFWLDTIIIV